MRLLRQGVLRQGVLALGAGAFAATLLAFAGPAFRGEADAAMEPPVTPVKLKPVSAFGAIKNPNERAVALFEEAGKVIMSPRPYRLPRAPPAADAASSCWSASGAPSLGDSSCSAAT